ncbi:glycosyltransferase family 2 protein [Bizionia sediminis]|uniref:Glycosyltransferase family 2 protein n=1 Tax=Bizionia sediminis TaxID=1737064 RepID=A0ABW5KY59_9FLAO
MLSILIPTYNYNVYPLVLTLVTQAQKSAITFEIICIDDGSNGSEIASNEAINTIENCSFIARTTNTGRTKTRQELAEKATYQWLLFLDADVMPKQANFLENYIALLQENQPVIFGGIAYHKNQFRPENALRFKFGSKREVVPAAIRQQSEYRVTCSANFVIKKNLFLKTNQYNLAHRYGMDYVFGNTLKAHNIAVKHTNNEVYHLGIDANKDFLEKTKQSLQTLNILNPDDDQQTPIRLLKYYLFLKQLYLHTLFGKIMLLMEPTITKYLTKNKAPNLFVFDLYRLGYFCRIRSLQTE